MLDRSQSVWRLTPLRIAAIYLVLGALWIIFSDSLVAALTTDPDTLTQLQTLKGWFYVLVTTWLLYELIRRGQAALHQSQEDLRRANERLVASNLQQREAATESQRRATELETVIESIVDPVFFVDAGGRLALTNEAGARLLRLDWPKDRGLSITTFPRRARMRHLDGRPVTMEDAPLARALRGETVTAEDSVVFSQQAGQDVYVSISTAPIRDKAGQIVGAVGVARDVTELIEVDRMKDDFIRVAAHELKTPVAIMKGYAEILMRTPRPKPAQRDKMLGAIDRGADRITRIIDDLLDVSQLQLERIILKRERIDLPRLVRSVMDRMAPTAPKHRLRLVRVEPGAIEGDRQRLEQVVVQLIENAVKYSPQGGDVDVSIEVRDGQAVVSVRDHGVGIPRDKQARIFQRFYRAHTGTPYDYGGMGVGLYIAREIVRAHGGQMWFTSEEGKGSTFYFSLPLGTAEPGHQGHRAERTGGSQRRGRRERRETRIH